MKTKSNTAYALSAVALAGCSALGNLPINLNSPLNLGTNAGQAGSLEVSVNLSQRTTQALFPMVSTVSISVQNTKQTSTISDGIGQILSGVASASFTGLQAGPATVSANVLDASGVSIGSGSIPVTIAGQTSASLGVGVASGSAGASPSILADNSATISASSSGWFTDPFDLLRDREGSANDPKVFPDTLGYRDFFRSDSAYVSFSFPSYGYPEIVFGYGVEYIGSTVDFDGLKAVPFVASWLHPGSMFTVGAAGDPGYPIASCLFRIATSDGFTYGKLGNIKRDPHSGVVTFRYTYNRSAGLFDLE